MSARKLPRISRSCLQTASITPWTTIRLTPSQANPKLANTKDDDDRLPIHWAVAYNHLPIVELLVSIKNFDPDVEVCAIISHHPLCRETLTQSSGWLRLDTTDDRFELEERRR